MWFEAVAFVLAVAGAFLCYSQGYRDGREDTRLRLCKPARRLAERAK